MGLLLVYQQRTMGLLLVAGPAGLVQERTTPAGPMCPRGTVVPLEGRGGAGLRAIMTETKREGSR